MCVLILAAAKGTVLLLEVDGPDEKKAVEAIEKLFAEGFGEEI